MKNYTIPQTKGNNLRQVVSKLLVKSPITAIKEFVSNSWDADAENVKVQIVDSERYIFIEDDGTGMSETGLENFLSMGDSEKLQNPITEKGRKKIGKFGIANTLLQYLGESYQLQTWKGNAHIDGFEEFFPVSTGGIRYDVHENPTKKHGTSILIERSRFVGSPLLKLDRLEDALAWELPSPREDFKIILNCNEVKRIIPDPIKVLEFHEDLPAAGEIDMKIAIYDKPVKINGIYVYVNQRSVGSPEIFQLKKVLRFSPSKVLITVNADGLKDSIVFNREKIIENEAFIELRKYIHQRLYGIGKGVSSSKEKIIEPTRDIISHALKKTSYLEAVPESIVVPTISPTVQHYPNYPMNLSGNGNGNGKPHYFASILEHQDHSKKTQSLNDASNNHKKLTNTDTNVLGFKTVHKGQCDSPATFNSSTRQISYNQNHPLISSSDITNAELLNIHILLATSIGIAEESFLKQGGSPEYVTRFNSLLSKVLSTANLIDSVMQSRNSNETGRFAPSRDYYLQEILDQGIATPISLRALIKTGIFVTRGNRISGKDINDYIAKSTNHTPAIDLVCYEWGKAQVESKKLTRARIGQITHDIDNRLTYYAPHLPFIYNIGVTRPFFLVENEFTPSFLGLLAQGVFRGRNGYLSSEDLIESHLPLIKKIVGNNNETRFAPLDDLCGITRGSPYEVLKIVGYSQKHGIVLPTKRQGDQVLYSVQHFKKARLYYLEGKNE